MVSGGLLPDVHAVLRRRLGAPQATVARPTRLDQEQSAGRQEQQGSHAGEAERPTQIVVLPVGHPVAVITVGAEYADGYETEKAPEH